VIDYLTLSVCVQALDGQRYEAIVRGPSGDGRAQFELAFAEGDLAALATAVSRPRSSRRRLETDESAFAREFGDRLFGLVFQDTARDVLRASLSQTQGADQGLRLLLQLDGAPALRNVPWELLWDRPKFISTSAYTPVLRYVDLPLRRSPLELRSPLRILGMVSSPGDMPALDTADEQAQLVSACRHLIDDGLLEIHWVTEATLSGLLEQLNNGTYHIFHFMGHGDFDERAEDGVLLFEGPAGRSHRVPGAQLGTILDDHRTLRLAVINACEGARTANDSSGVASSLMEYGLPAVIAMQFEISDVAAISFARSFYESLAKSHPVDRALADARRGMFASGHGLEWATPVMFTSVEDFHLFNLHTPVAAPSSAPTHGADPPHQADPTSEPQSAERQPSASAGAWLDSAMGNRENAGAYASFGRRVLASIIDGIPLLIVYSLLAEGLKGLGYGFGVLVVVVYYVYFEGNSGQTPGKRVMRLRVVGANDGAPIGYGRALVRTLGHYISAFVFFGGYLTMRSDPKRQCWHDKMANTIVICTS
jgi:uncharacterized RDD family membrane protein YckC